MFELYKYTVVIFCDFFLLRTNERNRQVVCLFFYRNI